MRVAEQMQVTAAESFKPAWHIVVGVPAAGGGTEARSVMRSLSRLALPRIMASSPLRKAGEAVVSPAAISSAAVVTEELTVECCGGSWPHTLRNVADVSNAVKSPQMMHSRLPSPSNSSRRCHMHEHPYTHEQRTEKKVFSTVAIVYVPNRMQYALRSNRRLRGCRSGLPWRTLVAELAARSSMHRC